MKKLQQGDVILKNIEYYNIDINEQDFKKLDHLTLAEGEATGHHHTITAGVAELMLSGNTMLLKVLSDFAKLKHQEHNEIEIPKGDYIIDIVREYDPFEDRVRRVAD